MLWHIHVEVAGPGRGRKHRVDVLNRAAVVFISACWESYVEDVATEAFDFMLAEVDTPDAIPAKVRTLASRELRDAKDERRLWELAGTGWRKIMADHRDAVVRAWLRDFNTPKAKQVSDLFCGLIGLPDVTAAWTWQAMNAEQARIKLDEYMMIRGNIAHRTKHDETVYKSWGKDFLLHVSKLVERTDDAVQAHLQGLSGKCPWTLSNARDVS